MSDAAGPTANRPTASGPAAAGPTGPLRVAVAVHTFPALSETFVLEPVVRLLERGHDVRILALYRGEAGAAHPAVAAHGLLERATFLIDDRPGRGRVRKALRGGRNLLRPGRLGLPWRRMAADAAAAPVRKVAPELVLAALGAAAGGREPLGYDVIHAHMGRVALIVQHLREWGALRGPLLATFHGSDVLVEPKRHPAGLYDRLFAGAEAFTANTDFLLGELRALGAPAERCHRLPAGVDLGQLEARPRAASPDGVLRVLTVARLVRLKGLDYGIRAIHTLRGRGVPAAYTIVGEGPERGRLETLIRELGLDDAVTLTGPLTWDRVREAYASHDVFLLPGIVDRYGGRESQGRVLVEAQATGMPVVATRVGGVAEAVDPGAGLLVEPGDAAALADALDALRRDAERWPEMGRRGRAHVEARFDDARLVDTLEGLYRRMAGA